MKIIITLLLLLMPIVAISANKTIKVGKNYIEVTPSKVMTDINGNPVEVWYESDAETYSQGDIDKRATQENKEMIEAQAINCPAHKQEHIDKIQARKNKTTIMQTEMDKKL